MPAVDSGRTGSRGWGQASDKPQGRKPREKNAGALVGTVLWGFEGGVVRIDMIGSQRQAVCRARTGQRAMRWVGDRTLRSGIGTAMWFRHGAKQDGNVAGGKAAICGLVGWRVRTVEGQGGSPPRCGGAQGA